MTVWEGGLLSEQTAVQQRASRTTKTNSLYTIVPFRGFLVEK